MTNPRHLNHIEKITSVELAVSESEATAGEGFRWVSAAHLAEVAVDSFSFLSDADDLDDFFGHLTDEDALFENHQLVVIDDREEF